MDGRVDSPHAEAFVEIYIFCFKITCSICEICATFGFSLLPSQGSYRWPRPWQQNHRPCQSVLVLTLKTSDLSNAFGTERRNRRWVIRSDCEERVGGRRSFEVVWRTYVRYDPGPAKSLRTMTSNYLRLPGSTFNSQLRYCHILRSWNMPWPTIDWDLFE